LRPGAEFSAAFSGGPIEATDVFARAAIARPFSAAFSGGPIEASTSDRSRSALRCIFRCF